MFDLDCYELLEAAVSAYEPIVGDRMQRARVFLYNAACAVTFLASRAGTRPSRREGAKLRRWSPGVPGRLLLIGMRHLEHHREC